MPKSSAQARSGYIASIRDAGSSVKKNNKEFEDKKNPCVPQVKEHREEKTACEKVNIRKCVFVHEVWRE